MTAWHYMIYVCVLGKGGVLKSAILKIGIVIYGMDIDYANHLVEFILCPIGLWISCALSNGLR